MEKGKADLTPNPQEPVPSPTSAGSSKRFQVRHWQILVLTLIHMVHLATDRQRHTHTHTHT